MVAATRIEPKIAECRMLNFQVKTATRRFLTSPIDIQHSTFSILRFNRLVDLGQAKLHKEVVRLSLSENDKGQRKEIEPKNAEC